MPRIGERDVVGNAQGRREREILKDRLDAGMTGVERLRGKLLQAILVFVEHTVEQVVDVVAPTDQLEADLVDAAKLGEVRERRALFDGELGRRLVLGHGTPPRAAAHRPAPTRWQRLANTMRPPVGVRSNDASSTRAATRYIPYPLSDGRSSRGGL